MPEALQAMSTRYCPECGHPNPADARYCMNCGTLQGGQPGVDAAGGYVPPPRAPGIDRDWTTSLGTVLAAALAFLSMRHMSRKARQTTILFAFLMFFFGCPMICGCVMAGIEGLARLVQ